MDLHAELARLNATPELTDWVAGTVQKLLDQARQDAATLKAANLKIQALAMELAHHRRITRGSKRCLVSKMQLNRAICNNNQS